MISNNTRPVKIWLFFCILFVLLMVFIGGFTRLTRSGLSITEWNFITGILPPINETEWLEEFEKYKKIPEFYILNQDMKIYEFKKIYLTEYFHRLVARLTGVIFIIPLIFLFILRKISFNFFLKNLGIFLLIIGQGLVGWLMVRSGLKDRISVSEFMLGFHLLFALLIFSLISWQFLKIIYQKKDLNIENNSLKIVNFMLKLAIFVFLPVQIFFGGLVAGLHINGFCFENSHELCAHNPFKIINFENFFMIKYLYIHRMFAIFVFSFLSAIILINLIKKIVMKDSLYLLCFLLLQMILGVLSILIGNNEYNIIYASFHQLNAFFIMFMSLKIFRKYNL